MDRVGLSGRWEWPAVPVAGQVLYLLGGSAQRPAYGVVLAVAYAGTLLRRRTPS